MARKKITDINDYTPAQIRKLKAKTKEYYQEQGGEVSVKVLSRFAKVPQGTIREWMREEDWDKELKEDPEDIVKLSDKTVDVLSTGAEKFNLTEQEELFCYHYMKTFNATTSAIKAGYSSSYAHNKAYRLLKTDKVKSFISEVKLQRNQELFLEPMRIIQEYMKIAFADMTDFVKFGPGGLVLKPSSQVDGQLITKVREGKDGVSVELADKMVALTKLEQYLEVMPEDWKKLIAQKKLDLMEKKMQLDNDKDSEPLQVIISRKGES